MHRIFEVIKHGDGSDDIELSGSKEIEQFSGRENVLDEPEFRFNGDRDIRRIYAELRKGLRVVSQQCSIIAPYIEGVRVTFPRKGCRLDGYASQMIAHGLVCARAIPIVRVKNRRRNGILHLEQTAGSLLLRWIATYEGRRNLSQRWSFVTGLEKRPLQALLTQINDFDQ